VVTVSEKVRCTVFPSVDFNHVCYDHSFFTYLKTAILKNLKIMAIRTLVFTTAIDKIKFLVNKMPLVKKELGIFIAGSPLNSISIHAT